MLNIKQTFAPSANDMPDQSQDQTQVAAATPPSPIPVTKRKSRTNLLLGAALLALTLLGGGVASYLAGTSQDLRQQAAGLNDEVFPTVTPDSCANFSPEGVSCEGDLGGGSCANYKTCSNGTNYNSCNPKPNNLCDYTLKDGTKCDDRTCPSLGGTNMKLCKCPNGASTIGTGDSCEQLCICTRNVCNGPTCEPSPTGPTDRPPKPTNTPPPITNTPPAGPQCTNIRMQKLDGTFLTGQADKNLKPGQQVRFVCSATGTVDHYEFRAILPDGTRRNKSTNPSLIATGNISEPFTIPEIGHFIVQCRVCTSATACQPYESIPNSSATQLLD